MADIIVETGVARGGSVIFMASLLEIIGTVEDRFAVQVDEDDLVDLKNVGDLLRVLNRAPKRS